jgi:hypothetical protein
VWLVRVSLPAAKVEPDDRSSLETTCYRCPMDLVVGGTNLATIASQGFQSCSLAGSIYPRLRFALVATRTPWSPEKEIGALIIGGELFALNQVIGTLEPVMIRLRSGPAQPHHFQLTTSVSPRSFAWLTDHRPGNDLQFVVKPQIVLFLDDSLTDAAEIRDIQINVSQSQWHALLAQANAGEYRVIEIALPKSAPRAERVRAALKLLDDAETLFAEGRDAEVLGRCYNVMEKLLGKGQDARNELGRIFGESPRTNALNTIVEKLRSLAHEGRHISAGADEFSANHADAEFMIGAVRHLIAYVAKSDQALDPE